MAHLNAQLSSKRDTSVAHLNGDTWVADVGVVVYMFMWLFAQQFRTALGRFFHQFTIDCSSAVVSGFWGGHRHHIIADASAADGYFWVSFGRVSWECPERSVRASTIGHGGPKPTETVRIPTVFRRLSKLMWSLLASLGALVNPCFGSSYRSAGAVRGR